MNKQQVSKKQLDRAISQEVVSDFEKFEFFFGKYWRHTILAGVVLVLLISLVFGLFRYRQSNIREANALLSAAKTEAELVEALKKHPDAAAAVSARLRLAIMYLADKKYVQAEEQFKAVAENEDLNSSIRERAMLNRAYLMEQSGREKEAAAEFENIGRNPKAAANIRAEANYSAGRIYLKLKEYSKSKAALDLAAAGAASEQDAFGWGRMAAMLSGNIPAEPAK